MTRSSTSGGSTNEVDDDARKRRRAAAGRRVVATAFVVAGGLACGIYLAWRDMKAADARVPDDAEIAAQLQERQARLPVSRYELRTASDDGRRVRARLWVGTTYEYEIDVVAGERTSARAVGDAKPGAPPAPEPFTEKDGRVLPQAGSPLVWSTFDEPCAGGGTTTSWRLCPEGRDDACIVAPAPDRCYAGALRLVALHRAGDVRWAVVERRMGDRVARMVAGAVVAP